jgi:hypothetical protein
MGYEIFVQCDRKVWNHGGVRGGKTNKFHVGLSHTQAGAEKRASMALRALEKRRFSGIKVEAGKVTQVQ